MKLDAVIVAGSIAREKTARGSVSRLSPVSPSSGCVSTTVGGGFETACGMTSIAATSGSSAEP